LARNPEPGFVCRIDRRLRQVRATLPVSSRNAGGCFCDPAAIVSAAQRRKEIDVMRTTMARGLTGGALLILTLMAATPARAEVFYYPWCIQYGGGRQGIDATSCGFDSYAQCRMSASGLSASCVENPASPPPRSHAKRARHRHRLPE